MISVLVNGDLMTGGGIVRETGRIPTSAVGDRRQRETGLGQLGVIRWRDQRITRRMIEDESTIDGWTKTEEGMKKDGG